MGLQNLTEFFKALGDPTRQRIINLLLYSNSLHVNKLCRILNEPQSKISRHLNVLKNAGWLVSARRDRWIYYRIDPELPQDLLSAIKNMFRQYLEFETDINNFRKQH